MERAREIVSTKSLDLAVLDAMQQPPSCDVADTVGVQQTDPREE